ncbi:hypothetical protein [Microbulbifer pacificus]|uniref:Uncharacterized protein n=1 Tax=Microbulbifer pacificus TaxID=407164 RepID=A0AAU0N346_9GAMM|nr:hypothetical protein [Microbulbifer pacificus]WOX06917.1 hypothetical protein R5R33_07220 [Microbulbifer pacificus]
MIYLAFFFLYTGALLTETLDRAGDKFGIVGLRPVVAGVWRTFKKASTDNGKSADFNDAIVDIFDCVIKQGRLLVGPFFKTAQKKKAQPRKRLGL